MRLLNVWNRLRSSFWFLPSVMAGAAFALSFVLIELDGRTDEAVLRAMPWIHGFGPEGARAILSAIASSMITVAGLSFSITMLTLQLASSQYGPRLLRNFMRDRGNQVVLGTFIATFLYCLLVLRTVRGVEGASFVPHLSVAFGVLLAVASLAVLIYFIHHVATAIRIETVLAELAAEARAAIDRLYPDPIGTDPPAADEHAARGAIAARLARDARRVRAREAGYVQGVDEDALMRLAAEHDLLVRIDARPGRFVGAGEPIVSVHPSDVPDDVAARLGGALYLGPDRTPQQDVEFSIRRIVEIAQRALSASVNDPTTALYCIDRLGEALGRLAEREPPAPVRFDARGRPRVLTEVASVQAIAGTALSALARYTLDDAEVVAHLLRAIERLAARMPPGTAGGLDALAEAIRREGEARARLPSDRQAIRDAAAGDDASRAC